MGVIKTMKWLLFKQHLKSPMAEGVWELKCLHRPKNDYIHLGKKDALRVVACKDTSIAEQVHEP